MEQTKNIKLVQGYLKKSNINIVDLIGVVTMIILTKDIFKKNSEVGKFINEILNVHFPEYVIKSRTLMAARTGRLVMELDEHQIMKIQLKIVSYLEKLNDSESDEKPILRKKKKKNENEKLEKWLKGL